MEFLGKSTMNIKRVTYGQGWIFTLLILLYQNIAIAEVAKVIFSKGQVYAVDLNHQQRNLQKKSLIQQGDTILTKDGSLQLRFTDGGLVSFYENTEFKVEEYQFTDKGKKDDKALFKFVKGMYRTVLGKIKQERYQVKTNVASIGTRGTEYRATLADSLQVDVFEGIVVLNNSSGDFIIPAGQSALVSDNMTRPLFLEFKNRGYGKGTQKNSHKGKQPPPPKKGNQPPPPPKNGNQPPPPPAKNDGGNNPPPPPPLQNNLNNQGASLGDSNNQLPPPPPPPAIGFQPGANPPPVRDKESQLTNNREDITIESILNGSISVESLKLPPPPQIPAPPPIELQPSAPTSTPELQPIELQPSAPTSAPELPPIELQPSAPTSIPELPTVELQPSAPPPRP